MVKVLCKNVANLISIVVCKTLSIDYKAANVVCLFSHPFHLPFESWITALAGAALIPKGSLATPRVKLAYFGTPYDVEHFLSQPQPIYREKPTLVCEDRHSGVPTLSL